MRENARHAELGHVGNVARADHLPFVHKDWIDPGVIRAVADSVVVEVRDGFMEIVEHLGVPAEVCVQDILRKLEGHAHGVAVIVVGHVFAPVDQRRIEIFGMGEVPFVEIDHAVAAVHFNDWSNQRDDAVADFADVGTFVDGKAVSQFHQCGGCARFRRVDCAGNVIDGDGFGDEFVGFGVFEMDGARVGEFRKALAVLLEVFEIGFRRDGHGDHFAAFFGGADGDDFYARRGFLEQAHIFVHVFRVREDAGSAGDVAEDSFGRGHGFAGGQIVDEGRGEVRRGGVLADFGGVGLVDGLLGIARRGSFSVAPGEAACCQCCEEKQNESQPGLVAHEVSFMKANAGF